MHPRNTVFQKLEYNEPIARSLERFCDRPFFRRIWIVQELVLKGGSAILMCGDARFTLETFMELCRKHIDYARRIKTRVSLSIFTIPPLYYIGTSRRERFDATVKTAPAFQLIKLLQITSDHQASDRRDMLYGLLGLLGGRVPPELIPAYQMPHGQVFHMYTKWLLLHTGDLVVLEGRPVNDQSVPSWVTWLNIPPMDLFLTAHNIKAPQRRGPVALSDDGRRLRVRGLRLSEIDKAQLRTSSENSTEDTLRPWLRAFDKDIVQTICTHHPEQNRDIVLQQIFSHVLKGVDLNFHQATTRAFQQTVDAAEDNVQFKTEVLEIFRKFCLLDWLLVNDGTLWYSPFDGCRASEGDVVFFFIGSLHATIVRERQMTNNYKRIDTCMNRQVEVDLRCLTTEGWAMKNTEELELS